MRLSLLACGGKMIACALPAPAAAADRVIQIKASSRAADMLSFPKRTVPSRGLAAVELRVAGASFRVDLGPVVSRLARGTLRLRLDLLPSAGVGSTA